ncbi:MAG: response regulator, partial [Holophagales bacterium]|nr:response regulator [Holophagales bacterium]
LATLDSLVEQTGSGERRAMLLAEALRAADDPNVGGIEARAAGKGLDDLARRSEELAEDLATLRAELRAALGTTQAVRRSLDATTGQLVAGSRAARRVPVGQLFPRFERLVRGAAELGDKSIVLETRGAEVELDHDVLERIADPIIHLLTNAVHHGIESPEARSRAGKEERGTVRIEAAPKGRGILIEVADDGAGLDLEQLRRSAREKGLLRAGYTDPSSEALDLICRPGLTTAATVTTVVGRGVGMDAVRHAVEQLGGKLTVSFGRGSGTRFSIHIPSSRLWLEVLRLGVAESELLIPTDAVEKAHAVIPDRVRRGPDGAPYLERSDSRLELVEAAPRLGLPGPASGNGSAPAAEPHAPQGVAVEVRPRETVFGGDGEASSKHRARALVVDRVNGPEVVSRKDLGELLAPCPLFLGATIASDGRVIPLLDPIALLDLDPDPTPRAALSFPPTVPPPEILIADDSLSVRRVLAGRLEREGYRVTTAKDGQAARHLLARRPFSAVITDLEMPRSSGDALIADLRHRPSTRGLPVAVITTRSSSRHRELAEELGADLYLPKPVDLEALLAWLSSVLAEPHGDRKGP